MPCNTILYTVKELYYKLIVAPRKCDVPKTNICPRSKALWANMLVLSIFLYLLSTVLLCYFMYDISDTELNVSK